MEGQRDREIRAAFRARRAWIAIMAMLCAATAATSGLLWAIGCAVVAVVAMLTGIWVDSRRGGGPRVSRYQAVAAGLAMGFVLTVVVVALG